MGARYMCELPPVWLDALRNVARIRGVYAPGFEDSKIIDVLECMGLPGWKLKNIAGQRFRLVRPTGYRDVYVNRCTDSNQWCVGWYACNRWRHFDELGAALDYANRIKAAMIEC